MSRIAWFCTVALFLSVVSPSMVLAQDVAEPVQLEIPDGAQAGPDFDTDTATAAYIGLLSEEERERSNAYYEGGYWLQLFGLLYGLAILWLILGTGLSAKMRDLAEKVGRWAWLHTFVYAAMYVIVIAILGFAWSAYEGFYREHQYDLATQTFGGWFGEYLTGTVVNVIAFSLFAVLIYAVIRKARQTWWLWGTGVAVAFTAFLVFLTPVYVAPLFNDYKPLEEGPVRDSILSMARANGVPSDDVYWFDASRQSTRISANVSGMFGTTRISLNDNLLNRTSQEEIEAVMAHEIGHYVLNHSMKLLTYIGLTLALGFAFVAWSFGRVQRGFGRNWGIRDVGDVAGLPLFIALLNVFMFLATPAFNTIIRVHEAEADNYGINVSGQPDGFARVAMRLSEYRKIEPGPVERFIFFDHPSGYDRVRMAMEWKAENLDSEPK